MLNTRKRQIAELSNSCTPMPRKKARCHSDPEFYTTPLGESLYHEGVAPVMTRSLGTQTDSTDATMEDESDNRKYGSLFGSISSISSEALITPTLGQAKNLGSKGTGNSWDTSTHCRSSYVITQEEHGSLSQIHGPAEVQDARQQIRGEDTGASLIREDQDHISEISSFLPQNNKSLPGATTVSTPKMHKPLPGVDTPPAMDCELMPHQRIGLQWLLDHELGPDMGGVLADDMGLGKTVQALALILANPPKDPKQKTTLIVAPLALLKQWPREIDEKIKPGHKLSVHILHGEGKKITPEKLKTYDVVLTNYETLQRELKFWEIQQMSNIGRDVPGGALLLHKEMVFHRVILDEAHLIKNRETKTAKAAFALRAKYRLAMSGTPLMNRAQELYSLMRFLNIVPYNDFTVFFMSICRTAFDVKTGEYVVEVGATQRVKELRERTMLIRSKKDLINDKPIVPLPPCNILTVDVNFAGDADRKAYEEFEVDAFSSAKRLDRAPSGPLGKFALILSKLLRLRLLCLHPNFARKHSTELQNEEDERLTQSHLGGSRMPNDFVEIMDGDLILCQEIAKRHEQLPQNPSRRRTKDNSKRAKSEYYQQLETDYQPSGKINKIVELLFLIRKKNPNDRTIIFSSFTSFLDILEVALRREQVFKWQRYDGTMTPAAKDAAVATFMNAQNDASILLTSLRAGNAGLNLTIATHIIIVEPYWNPYVEQQAIDRAYRIGQTREVTVYKLVIPNTVEMRVVAMQEEKKAMVGWALGTGESEQQRQGGKNKGGAGLTKKDVLKLLRPSGLDSRPTH